MAMKHCTNQIVLVAAAFLLASAPAAVAQTSPHVLARQLSSGSGAERRHALTAIGDLADAKLTPEIVRAAVGELDRKNAEIASGRKPERGETLSVGDDPEAEFDYFSDLLSVVIRSHSPSGLHALVGSIGRGAGRPAFDEIASFGERAVPYLVRQSERLRGDAGGSIALMWSLKAVLQKNPRLSGPSRATLASLARPFLHGRQTGPLVVRALEVGVLANDAEAKNVIDNFARNGVHPGLLLEKADAEQVRKAAIVMLQSIR